jgi:type IV secretion system protein VirB8
MDSITAIFDGLSIDPVLKNMVSTILLALIGLMGVLRIGAPQHRLAQTAGNYTSGLMLLLILWNFAITTKPAADDTDMHRAVTYPCEQAMLEFAKNNGADPYSAHELIANTAVNNYYITHYILARESYYGSSPRDNYGNYNLVRVFSALQVFSDYQKQIILSNPESPGTRLGRTGSRQVTVSGISQIKERDLPTHEEARTYRASLQIREENGGVSHVISKSVIIAFKYTDLDLSESDRCLNTLGFRVLKYTYE